MQMRSRYITSAINLFTNEENTACNHNDFINII
jgi:hypothetical protein